jgi:hypothetical protein
MLSEAFGKSKLPVAPGLRPVSKVSQHRCLDAIVELYYSS